MEKFDTDPITLASTVKPGWQTTEFYLSGAAKILGILFASGLIGDGSIVARLAGLAAAVLTSLGYTVARGIVKSGAAALLIVIALQPSCAAVHKAPAAAGHAIADCAKADALPVALLVAQLGTQALLQALDVGKIMWSSLEEQAWAQGEKVGYCAAERFVASLGKEPVQQGLIAMPDPGEAMLARLRARWTVAP